MKSKSPTTEQPTEGWTNNIDWNNALVGSPRNVIELKIDKVSGGHSVTNAVDLQAKQEVFQKVFNETKEKLDEAAGERAAQLCRHMETTKP